MVLTPDAWQGSILTDYSVVEEVYLRMWGEHGKGPWASQQGSNQPENMARDRELVNKAAISED